MSINPLKELGILGQSLWLDYIRRDLLAGGELRCVIEEDGVRGMTSNPAIFEKAIAESQIYDEDIKVLALAGKRAEQICEAISQRDVQSGADEFRPLYDKTDGQDGYVSLEVNPHLARDINGTITEAPSLWATLDRPYVRIKVPATAEGLPAIQQLLSEGISVNVTLLFGLPRYRQVAEAYIADVESRAAQGYAVHRVASVASFFVSDVKYVEALIGLDTVDTAPMETIDAYRDHGEPKSRLEHHLKEAHWVLEQLQNPDISLDNVARQLEDEGVEKFCEPFDKLMKTVAQRLPRHLKVT